jgi:hypothetical protein
MIHARPGSVVTSHAWSSGGLEFKLGSRGRPVCLRSFRIFLSSSRQIRDTIFFHSLSHTSVTNHRTTGFYIIQSVEKASLNKSVSKTIDK